MSNLGKYKDIVEAAAEAGGVDALIARIEANAVAKAAPGLVVKGAIGMGTAIAAVWGARKLYSQKRASQEALSDDAKAKLKATIDGTPESGNIDELGSGDAAGTANEEDPGGKGEDRLG